jgi:pimeloyl-ACP methyl ester carboxylesterase
VSTSVHSASFLTVDGLRLRVSHTRPPGVERPPVVLVLHGWGASVDAVGSILAGLRDKVELVAPDLPGFGESDMVPAAWSNADYARLVIGLADQLGIDRFALVGHSRGAAVSLVLASDPATSGRIERMVLTGAAGIKPRRGPSYYGKVGMAKAGRAVGAVGGAPGRKLQQRIRARAASADWLAAPEALRGTLRNVLAEDLSPRLPHVKAPTLLIWGPHDDSTPLWMAEKMEREIPGAGLVVLRDGGHFAYAERAGEFNVIAAHFLTQASAAPARSTEQPAS